MGLITQNNIALAPEDADDIRQIIFLLVIGVRNLLQRGKELGVIKTIRSCIDP